MSNVCSTRTDGRVGGDVGASAVALPPSKTGPATTGVVDSSFYEAISWPQRYTWTMTSTRLASWRCRWRCTSRPQAVRAPPRPRPVGGTAMRCPRGPGTNRWTEVVLPILCSAMGAD